MAKGGPQSLEKALISGDPNRWNAARESVESPALAGVDLANATLADFDLSHADLTNADLSEADLTGASIDNARLDGADLTGAKLLEVDVSDASFAGASFDKVRMEGTFLDCDFTSTTWEGALVRGVRFIQCDFEDAEIDVAAMVRNNRFERCTFGERDDLPDDVRVQRPEFLQPPMLEGERIRVDTLRMAFSDDSELKREAIGAATGAGWESEMVAFLRDGARTYVGLRPEAGVDVLEEWIAFEPRDGEGLVAVELSVDPGFETFLEEMVIPMFESSQGDLLLVIEQDLEQGGSAITEVAIQSGKPQPPKQYKRASG